MSLTDEMAYKKLHCAEDDTIESEMNRSSNLQRKIYPCTTIVVNQFKTLEKVYHDFYC